MASSVFKQCITNDEAVKATEFQRPLTIIAAAAKIVFPSNTTWLSRVQKHIAISKREEYSIEPHSLTLGLGPECPPYIIEILARVVENEYARIATDDPVSAS